MYVGPLTSLGHRESNAGTYVSVLIGNLLFINSRNGYRYTPIVQIMWLMVKDLMSPR